MYCLNKLGINAPLRYDTPMTRDDPNEIAEYLIQQHGLEGALDVAIRSAATSTDNYALSVWREVKVILQGKGAGSKKEHFIIPCGNVRHPCGTRTPTQGGTSRDKTIITVT